MVIAVTPALLLAVERVVCVDRFAKISWYQARLLRRPPPLLDVLRPGWPFSCRRPGRFSRRAFVDGKLIYFEVV